MYEFNIDSLTKTVASLIGSFVYFVLKHCQFPDDEAWEFVTHGEFLDEYRMIDELVKDSAPFVVEEIDRCISEELKEGTYPLREKDLSGQFMENILSYHLENGVVRVPAICRLICDAVVAARCSPGKP